MIKRDTVKILLNTTIDNISDIVGNKLFYRRSIEKIFPAENPHCSIECL
jgi:hypothetical protein